jgi:Flp pilus assembly protein TadD
MKVVDAAIVVADLEGSSEFANLASLEEYNRLVREYQWRAHEAILRYTRESALTLANVERAGRGDEVVLIVHSLTREENAVHALKLALLLREAWLYSDFNRKRLEDGKDFAHVRVGIGEGRVVVEKGAWAQSETAEGFAISQAKRIEGEAGTARAKILLKATLKPFVEKGVSGITLGETRSLGKLKGVGEVEACPVEAYDGWLAEMKQRREEKETDRYILNMQGYMAQMSGDLGEARRLYEKALVLNPQSASVHNQLGSLAEAEGNFKEAEREFRLAVSLAPGEMERHGNLGLALLNQRKFEESLPEFEAALRAEGEEQSKWQTHLAAALHSLGRFDESLAAYLKAVAMNPDYPTVHYNLACLYAQMGRKAHALEELKEARRTGFKTGRQTVREDPDFASLLGDPEFEALAADWPKRK